MGKKAASRRTSPKSTTKSRNTANKGVAQKRPSKSPSAQRREPYKLFFSHKDKDEAEFRRIADHFEAAYGDLVEVFIAERMPAGTKWFEKIMVQIRDADLFIFVYTDPSLVWDFPIFESGVRLGYDWSESTSKNPMIRVIRHETTAAPSPYWGTQNIEVSNDNLARIDEFLIDIHKKITRQRRRLNSLDAIGKECSSHLTEIRHLILDLINEGTKQQLVYPPELEINMARSTDLRDAKVIANTTFAILSGTRNTECAWGEFLKRLSGRCKISEGWCECLIDAVRRSAAYSEPTYPLPLLRLKRDENFTELRPNITAVTEHRNGSVTVRITLTLLPPMTYEEDLHQLVEFLVGAKRLRFSAIESILAACTELEGHGEIAQEEVMDLARHSHIALTSTLEDAYGAGYDREPCKLSLAKFGAGQDLDSLFQEWDAARDTFRTAASSESDVVERDLLNKLVAAAETLKRLNPIFTKRAATALNAYFDSTESATKPVPPGRVSRFFGFK